ncbi:MAG: methylated-DNA--[protein]-cysteine S-methyltransferase [Gammaproteobacteria bacterium]|nr:methylated-DNA--[protein]-cysteine S-methyltransferase [Gammaproteobacteria bacterium]
MVASMSLCSPDTSFVQIPMDSPLGWLCLSYADRRLVSLDIIGAAQPSSPESRTPSPEWLSKPLLDYFADGKRPIALPLDLRGTDFQRRVWQALLQIPPGQTRSYGQLAQQLSSSAQAVGNACRANPCPIVVPCHRVLARNGLGGYAGQTQGEQLQIKRWLLRHEGVALD